MPTLPGVTGSKGSLLRESVLYTRIEGVGKEQAELDSTEGAEVAIGVLSVLRMRKWLGSDARAVVESALVELDSVRERRTVN